jgi:endonuclease G
MKKLTLICIPFFLIAAGCKKDTDNPPNKTTTDTTKTPATNDTTKTTTPVTPTLPKPYSLTETFEYGSKTAYAPAYVTLSSGVWYFDEALIGNTSADIKNGKSSARTNYGDCAITMMFDVTGVTQISFKYAFNDPTSYDNYPTTLQLMMSTDGGATFNQVGNTISTGKAIFTFVTASFNITTSAKVRFKILKTGSPKINVDDITFVGTGDPGFTLTK